MLFCRWRPCFENFPTEALIYPMLESDRVEDMMLTYTIYVLMMTYLSNGLFLFLFGGKRSVSDLVYNGLSRF